MASNSPLDNRTLFRRPAAAAALLALAGVAAAAGGCRDRLAPPPGTPPTLANRNVRFGMPAPVPADPAGRDAYLIDRPQYVLSYNDSTKTPNWVSWNLNAGDIGKAPRAVSFEPDPELPREFHHVKSSDYTGSGFDRGHMCPAKDRSATEDDERATFYTTNIVPQSPDCNRKGWEAFESHCRDLVHKGGDLYIVSGPHGHGGTGEHGERKTVGKEVKIAVPAAVWKVVMVLPGKDDVPTAATRTLAVWMPNDQTIPKDWKPYAVSVAEVEKRTGYKFFPLVPDDVAAQIKSHVNHGP
jgi:endonuclease G